MGTADSALRFNLFARDQTGPGIRSADSNFSKLGKGLVGKFAAAAGAIGAVSLFKGFIDEARESEKVGRLTENVIRSTGKAAKVSADQVGALATQLSNKTAVDDEVIQSGQNLLLTFTGIRNEVGKGNNIFDQASKAALDMAAGLNGGNVTAENLKGTSVQLGKALNDPIKGITALSRSGVSFTEAQKKQIKTMVEAGNQMGAQKIILAELNKEFGGAAAAAADPAQKAQVAWGNLQEQLGTQLLPVLNKVMGFLSNRAIPAVSKLVTNIQTGDGVFAKFRAGLAAVGAFITGTVVPALQRFGTWFTTVGWPAIQRFAQGLWTALQPAIAQIAKSFREDIQPALQNLIAKFKEAWPNIQRFGAILVQIGQVILTKVVPVILQLAGKHLAMTIRVFGEVFSAVWKVVGVLIDVGAAFGKAGEKVGKFVAAVAEIPGKAVKAVGNLGSKLISAGEDLVRGMIQGIRNGAGWLAAEIKKQLVDKPMHLITHPWEILSPSKVTRGYGLNIAQGMALGVKDGSGAVGTAITAMVEKAKAKLAEVKEFSKNLRDTFKSLGDVTAIDTMVTDAEGNQSQGGLGALLAGLKKQADDAKSFTATIKRLRKGGLNETSLGNLRDAGPEGGLQAAQQLLSGGNAAIGQVNQLMKQLNQTGQVFANRESRAMYGFDSNGNAVKGQQVIRLSIDGSGDELTNAVVKALRTKVRVGGGSVQVVLGQGGR